MKMRVAVPSTDDKGLESEISSHFGRAQYYTLVDIENREITGYKVVRCPFSEHGPGDIPNFLRSLGVNVIIAYGMGRRAQDFFKSMGIEVVTGAYGKVKDVIRAFMAGSLSLDKHWSESEEFKHKHRSCSD
ncbi:MAG: NifB/NifX family molybdenum-iron cluster-binding protein [Candidatus Methanodesulfokora sp.]